jgi:agmatinase
VAIIRCLSVAEGACQTSWPAGAGQFDAHCDTWPDDGARFDHGTMFARAAAEGIIDVSRSTQVGLRTYNDSDQALKS